MVRKAAQKALETYRQKRDFSKTSEPSGKRATLSKAKRAGHSFVVQLHAARRLHYDFRLELDGVLKSWAVTRGPSLDPADKRLAVEVEDHPLEYGSFEGSIPEGQYGGGTVMLWDQGTWEPIGDAHEGLLEGHLKFNLYGERMKGRWVLVRMKGRRKEDRRKSAHNNWLLIKERDEESRVGDVPVTEANTTSVETGRDFAAIAAGKAVWHSNRSVKENIAQLKTTGSSAKRAAPSRSGTPPAFVEPQLATLVDAPPKGDEWLHEIKLDGYRALASIGGGEAIIRTRTGLDWTDRFGTLGAELAKLDCRSALIDGEIAVSDRDGRTDFGALQHALSESEPKPLTYYVFDLLELNGKDLRKDPLLARKSKLKKLIQSLKKTPQLIYSDHVAGKGPEIFAKACDLKLEGIISKRADAPYRSGRTKTWLKIKCGLGEEFVIIGWRPSDVQARPLSSLLIATRVEDQLRYAGRVGSGFDETNLDQLARLLKAREQKSPAVEVPREIRRDAHFVKPDLVAEISFRGWTDDGVVRQASFKGLRSDKPARDVREERARPMRSVIHVGKEDHGTALIEGVRVTHPDKLLFKDEKISKQDLIDHFLAFAEPMLAHIARRPLSLVRCPDGIDGQRFFQKHASPGFPDAFRKVKIKDKSGIEEFIYIEDRAGLVAAAQVGTIELHIWGAHIGNLEKPDRIVFDLDPDEELDFAAVKAGAKELRERLAHLKLTSFLMATGGKGLHVVVPIEPRHAWPDVKDFTHSLAAVMAQEDASRYTTVMAKAKRRGRIFIDYLRNERGSTAIAPFSVRARPGAPVALPIAWSALAKLESAHAASVRDARAKYRKDPWAGYFDVRQSLPLDRLRRK